MHEMNDEVILRILPRELSKSELRLQRYGEKNFRDLFIISKNWLGLYLEIRSDFGASVWKSGLRLDFR
jgi:hypothetical protein